MKIQVGGLSEGIHEYDFEVISSELNLAKNFSHKVCVGATLDKTVNQMFLKASIVTSGRFECDRCISEFEIPLSSTYQMYYMSEGSDYEHRDPVEVQVIPHGVTVIDIADDVRQTILLSVPLKFLCREDCKGLCPQCGKDRNKEVCTCSTAVVDSRWDQLRIMREGDIQN